MRKILATLMLFALVGGPASAQIPVTDAASLTQWINMVNRVKDTIEIMKEIRQTTDRIAAGYRGSLLKYRLAGIAPLDHDISRYRYGRVLLEGLNAGDPRGERYTVVLRKVMRPGGLYERLPEKARKELESSFAMIEIADSIGQLGMHESALSRGYSARLTTLIDHLQDDVTAGGSNYHEVTAIADKIAVAGLIDARSNQNINQVNASTLEQVLGGNMRRRQGLAAHNNMTIETLTDAGATSAATVANATSALSNWSLRARP